MKNNQQQGVRTRHVLGCARLLGDDGAAVARRPHHLLGCRLLLLRRRRDGLPLLSPAASSSLSTAAAAGSSFSLRSMVSAKPLLPEALLPSPSPPPGRPSRSSVDSYPRPVAIIASPLHLSSSSSLLLLLLVGYLLCIAQLLSLFNGIGLLVGFEWRGVIMPPGRVE
jgi:hypothetical protein